MVDKARRPSITTILRTAIAVPICAALAWGIVTTSLGAQAVRLKNSQLMAVFASGRQPDVATQLAAQFLAAKQNDEAIRLARTAVVNDPLNVNASTVLGLALEQIGQQAQANVILRRAGSIGWRNTASLVWNLKDAARRDDPVRIVRIADALARRQQVGALTRTVFFASLAEPRMRPIFVQRLATQPSWRPGFFADLHATLSASQLDGMDAVLRGLRATKAPPTPRETLIYVDRMIQIGAVERAHRYWGTSFAIPSAQLAARPFDGHFARAATIDNDTSKSPFEWQLDPDIDDTVSFVQEASGPALRIEPGVPDDTVIATQTIMLPPGEHDLQTKLAAGTGTTAPAGWTITCLPSNQPLLRTMAGDRRDELTRIAVTVPTQGCAAQLLRLVALDRVDAQPATIVSVVIH